MIASEKKRRAARRRTHGVIGPVWEAKAVSIKTRRGRCFGRWDLLWERQAAACPARLCVDQRSSCWGVVFRFLPLEGAAAVLAAAFAAPSPP